MLRKKLSATPHSAPGTNPHHTKMYGRGIKRGIEKFVSAVNSPVAKDILTAASSVIPAAKVAKTVFKVAEGVERAYTGKAATSIKNQFMTGAKAFQGETHAILKKPEGGIRLANFAGPGTKIIERLKRGDQPISPVDEAAEAHDIRYTLARTAKDVRDADQKLINRLAEMKRKNIDNPFNRTMIGTPIVAKMKLENVGLRNPLKNIDLNSVISPLDRKMLDEKLGQLVQKGSGETPPLPGMKLQEMLNKKPNKKKRIDNQGFELSPVATVIAAAPLLKRKRTCSKKKVKVSCKKAKRKKTASSCVVGCGSDLAGSGLKLAGELTV